MDKVAKKPVLLYTEETPNPETLKYVTNRMLYQGTAEFKDEAYAKEWSPLAYNLFQLPYVKSVYICNNFITVTKEFNYDWADIMLRLKQEIKQEVEADTIVINDGFDEEIARIEESNVSSYNYTGKEAELVQKIKELLDTYVKPAVEMDGGNIEFKSFDQGKVTLLMQGACSGCPSSGVTLKGGVENMLKRMVPEVTEVVAEMG